MRSHPGSALASGFAALFVIAGSARHATAQPEGLRAYGSLGAGLNPPRCFEADADVTLIRPSIDRARLVIAGEGTSIVTLFDARGDDASIELEGFATRRLRALREVSGLRIDAASTARGWDLEIEDSSLPRLAVRVGRDARLLVRGTQLSDARVSAGHLTLVTARIEDSVLDAHTLTASATNVTATGADPENGHLRARRGSFAGGALEGIRLHGCESFKMLDGTTIERSDIGACAASATEFWETTVDASIVRGRVFAVKSSFVDCILGAAEGASLSLVESGVKWSVMCDVEALSARGASLLFCARCDPGSPRAICIDGSSPVAVVRCPEVAEASTCDEPLPDSLLAPPASDAETPEAGADAGATP